MAYPGGGSKTGEAKELSYKYKVYSGFQSD